jgi:hypothetical protein
VRGVVEVMEGGMRRQKPRSRLRAFRVTRALPEHDVTCATSTNITSVRQYDACRHFILECIYSMKPTTLMDICRINIKRRLIRELHPHSHAVIVRTEARNSGSTYQRALWKKEISPSMRHDGTSLSRPRTSKLVWPPRITPNPLALRLELAYLVRRYRHATGFLRLEASF